MREILPRAGEPSQGERLRLATTLVCRGSFMLHKSEKTHSRCSTLRQRSCGFLPLENAEIEWRGLYSTQAKLVEIEGDRAQGGVTSNVRCDEGRRRDNATHS